MPLEPKKPPKMITPQGKNLLPPKKIIDEIFETHGVKRKIQLQVFFLIFEGLQNSIIASEPFLVKNFGIFQARKYAKIPKELHRFDKGFVRMSGQVAVPHFRADKKLTSPCIFSMDIPEQATALENMFEQKPEKAERITIPVDLAASIAKKTGVDHGEVYRIGDLLFRQILIRIFQRKQLAIQGLGTFVIQKKEQTTIGNLSIGEMQTTTPAYFFPRFVPEYAVVAKATKAWRKRSLEEA